MTSSVWVLQRGMVLSLRCWGISPSAIILSLSHRLGLGVLHKSAGAAEEKLWVTIYLDDDEAFDIWTKEIGVSPERIVRLGKEDNFWEHGSRPLRPLF